MSFPAGTGVCVVNTVFELTISLAISNVTSFSAIVFFINSNVKKGRTYYYKIVAVYSSSLCNSYKSPAAKIKLQ